MKFRFSGVLLATSILIFCAMTAAAQRPVLGGYKKAAADSDAVVAAADFAVKAQGEKAEVTIEVIEILAAETQVVAGTNYKMCLKVSSAGEDEEAAEYFVMAIVNMDLKKNYKLMSWTDSDCGGTDAN